MRIARWKFVVPIICAVMLGGMTTAVAADNSPAASAPRSTTARAPHGVVPMTSSCLPSANVPQLGGFHQARAAASVSCSGSESWRLELHLRNNQGVDLGTVVVVYGSGSVP